MPLPHAAKALLIRGSTLLMSDQVELVTIATVRVLVDGTPQETPTPTTVWTGLGSIQYNRPRIQKPFADFNAEQWEDPITAVVYLPNDAAPTKEMFVKDVDGRLGTVNALYPQSRKPANVGGVGVYFELYLGGASNAL